MGVAQGNDGGELAPMERLSNAFATAGEIITELAALPDQGLAPAWAVQLQLSLDRLQRDMDELKSSHLNTRTEVRREKVVAQLREQNRTAREFNRFAQFSTGHLTGLKRMPDMAPLVEGVPAPAEPDLLDPPPDFPETLDAIETLSHREIEALLTAYGQETPREVEEARRAFTNYICRS